MVLGSWAAVSFDLTYVLQILNQASDLRHTRLELIWNVIIMADKILQTVIVTILTAHALHIFMITLTWIAGSLSTSTYFAGFLATTSGSPFKAAAVECVMLPWRCQPWLINIRMPPPPP